MLLVNCSRPERDLLGGKRKQRFPIVETRLGVTGRLSALSTESGTKPNW